MPERKFVIARHLVSEGKDHPQYLGSGDGEGSAWYEDINAPEVLKSDQRFMNYHLEWLRLNSLQLVCGAKVEPV